MAQARPQFAAGVELLTLALARLPAGDSSLSSRSREEPLHRKKDRLDGPRRQRGLEQGKVAFLSTAGGVYQKYA